MINNKQIPISTACSALEISRKSFYDWKDKPPDQSECFLRYEIRQIALEFQRYGYRRITKELHRRKWIVNHKKVLRIMKEERIICKKKSFRPQTTDSDHNKRIYPNLAKNLTVNSLNTFWVSDITYIRLRKGFVYLAVVIDVFSRKCIGWALDNHLMSGLAINALNMAIKERQIFGFDDLIHHSDRGIQYASNEYIDLLNKYGISISMSRKGNPYDNAFAESFMKTLKYEEVYINEYESIEEAERNIKAFIEEVYNKKRLHSSIGYIPPDEFESNICQGVLA